MGQPGILAGLVSLLVLALVIAAIAAKWLGAYIISAVTADSLNVLVLIPQLFESSGAPSFCPKRQRTRGSRDAGFGAALVRFLGDSRGSTFRLQARRAGL